MKQFSTSIRILVAAVILLITTLPQSANAQCGCTGNVWTTVNVSGWAVGQTQTVTCIYGGERSPILNTVSGAVYRFSTCGTSWDTQISVYTNPGCSFLGYNDDNGPGCGGLQASVDVTSTGGDMWAVVNEYNCISNTSCGNLFVQLISIPTPPTPLGCGVALEGPSPAQPTGCLNQIATFGAGAYRDINITANTYYNFTWTDNGAPNIVGFCATPQNGNATGFTTNQIGWFSGTTTVLRVSANRTSSTWATISAQLNYRHTDPVLSANTPATLNSCPGTAVSIAGGATIYGNRYWQGTTLNGTSIATPGTPNSTAVLSAPGTYTYNYNAANNGCWSTDQQTIITVLTPSLDPISAAATPATICTGAPVTLSVTGTLGTDGSVWTWYTGGCGVGTAIGTGASITLSPAGTATYYVRAEGGTCGTTGCASVTVTVNGTSTAPTAIVASSSNICAGSPVTLTATGGTLGSGSQYFWYIGSCGGSLVGSGPSINVSPLTTASYYVRAEGPCNITSCANAVINVTPAPSAGFGGITSPSGCGLQDGTIDGDATGGTPPYTFTWSGNLIGEIISGLGAGPYILTVTDASGCTDQSSVSLNDPNASAVTLTSSDADNAICAGETVIFTASGSFQYQYYINGNPVSTQNPFVTNTLTNGQTVSVVGTDVNFCSYTNSGITTVVREVPVISATVTDPSICAGADGSIQLVVTNGLPLYTFAWSNNATTQDVTGLVSAPYLVTVTDANGCSTNGTYGLSDPGAAPVTMVSSEDPNNVICAGENVTFTASGSNAYNFYVDGQPTSTANPFSTTTLTNGQSVAATGTDLNNCTATGNIVIVTVNPGPIVSILSNAVNNTICVGQSMSFFASGALTYEFLVNGQSQGASSSTSLFLSSTLQSGDLVSVIGTDANGCDVESAAITVTVNPSPVVTIVNQVDPSSCGAADGSLTAEVTIGTGTSPFTYQWAAGPASDIYTGLSAGSYFVEATDAAGCTATTTASLSDVGSSPVFLTSDAPNETVCGGIPVTFTATGATTYVFYVNGVQASTINPFVTTTLQDGDFVAVTGLDLQLCSATSSALQFTVLPEVQIGISNSLNPSGCQATDGAANTINIGGTPVYNYLWTDGQTTPNAVNLPGGQWAVTVTDANGCTATDAVSLSDVGATVAVLTASPLGLAICSGTEITFTGSGSLSYEFFLDGVSVGNTNPYINSALQDNETVALVGTDVNGCVYTTAGLTYQVSTAPAVGLTSVGSACENVEYIQLAGGSPVGGTYTVDYFGFPITAEYFFPGLAGPGNTAVIYTYEDPITGCAGTATADFVVFAPPVVDLGPDATACVYTLDAGAGFASYYWLPSGDITPTTVANATANYIVRVEDAVNGCFGYDTILLEILQIPTPFVNPNDTVEFCAGGSISVSAALGFNSYTWSGGTASGQPNVQIINQPGLITLTVTNPEGCEGTVDIFAIENQPMVVSSIEIIGTQPFCVGGSVVLDAGPGYASYLWNTGSTTSAITVLQSGSYWLSTMDPNGCIDSSLQATPVDILVWDPQPQVSVVADSLIVTDAFNYVGFQWFLNGDSILGATQEFYVINPTGSGNYEVQATDANGCVGDSETFELTCCTGIDETAFDGSVNVYPNPTNGDFIVDITMNASHEFTLDLVDLVGKVIWTDGSIGTTDQIRKQYSVKELTNGVYFLRVTADNKMSVVKLIKQ